MAKLNQGHKVTLVPSSLAPDLLTLIHLPTCKVVRRSNDETALRSLANNLNFLCCLGALDGRSPAVMEAVCAFDSKNGVAAIKQPIPIGLVA